MLKLLFSAMLQIILCVGPVFFSLCLYMIWFQRSDDSYVTLQFLMCFL